MVLQVAKFDQSVRPGQYTSVAYDEVIRPYQPNRVMLIAVSLPNHAFTVQA